MPMQVNEANTRLKKRQNKPIGEIAKTLGVIRLIIGTICKTNIGQYTWKITEFISRLRETSSKVKHTLSVGVSLS